MAYKSIKQLFDTVATVMTEPSEDTVENVLGSDGKCMGCGVENEWMRGLDFEPEQKGPMHQYLFAMVDHQLILCPDCFERVECYVHPAVPCCPPSRPYVAPAAGAAGALGTVLPAPEAAVTRYKCTCLVRGVDWICRRYVRDVQRDRAGHVSSIRIYHTPSTEYRQCARPDWPAGFVRVPSEDVFQKVASETRCLWFSGSQLTFVDPPMARRALCLPSSLTSPTRQRRILEVASALLDPRHPWAMPRGPDGRILDSHRSKCKRFRDWHWERVDNINGAEYMMNNCYCHNLFFLPGMGSWRAWIPFELWVQPQTNDHTWAYALVCCDGDSSTFGRVALGWFKSKRHPESDDNDNNNNNDDDKSAKTLKKKDPNDNKAKVSKQKDNDENKETKVSKGEDHDGDDGEEIEDEEEEEEKYGRHHGAIFLTDFHVDQYLALTNAACPPTPTPPPTRPASASAVSEPAPPPTSRRDGKDTHTNVPAPTVVPTATMIHQKKKKQKKQENKAKKVTRTTNGTSTRQRQRRQIPTWWPLTKLGVVTKVSTRTIKTTTVTTPRAMVTMMIRIPPST